MALVPCPMSNDCSSQYVSWRYEMSRFQDVAKKQSNLLNDLKLEENKMFFFLYVPQFPNSIISVKSTWSVCLSEE